VSVLSDEDEGGVRVDSSRDDGKSRNEPIGYLSLGLQSFFS